MRHAGLKIADESIADLDDRAAMSDALNRLYHATIHSVNEIVAGLSSSERARLAVFCYGRTHLNAVGLAIAATCELKHLMAASQSSTQGRALYVQSRELAASPAKPHVGRRPVITLSGTSPDRDAASLIA